MNFSAITSCLIFLIFFACNGKQEKVEDLKSVGSSEDVVSVSTEILQKRVFKQQIISQGKLTAYQRSELRFDVSGNIQRIALKNGDGIKKGMIIANLDATEYQQLENEAVTSLKKAKMDLDDLLIGQGYSVEDSANIPKKIYENALIRSGYLAAKDDLAKARRKVNLCKLISPIDGVVANINQSIYEQVETANSFCTVLDVAKMFVTFQLLENEIVNVRLGDSVKVYPLGIDEPYLGSVAEINPVIDENGLIQVKALVHNTGGLIDGMNAKVIVEKAVPNVLVVPKSAVVIRQNQKVLFKFVKGHAYWTYVHTIQENIDSYIVLPNDDKGANLQEGDTIIISDNLNLAHDAPISIHN